MSEEKFDKKIKEKLESIPIRYEHEAWEKLRRSMPVPWYISFLRDYGGWLYGGLVTAGFILYIYSNTSKILNDKNFTQKIQIDTVYIHHTDTVYIRHTDTVYTAYTTREVVSQMAMKYNKKSNNEKYNNLIINKCGIENKNRISSERNEVVRYSDEKGDDNNKRLSKSDTNKIALSSNAGSSEEKFTPREKPQMPKAIDSMVALVAKADTQKRTEKRESKLNLTFLKKINMRLGASFDYSDHKNYGWGSLVEIFGDKRWSITSGVVFGKIQKKEFNSKRDFNRKFGEDFDDRYKKGDSYIPPGEEIRHIKIDQRNIRIPLYVSYFIPLNDHWKTYFSLGTKLDVSILESVDFFKGTNTYEKRTKFEYSPKHTVFNNVYYGAGIEFVIRQLSFQFSPYFEYPFKNSFRIEPPKSFGIHLSGRFSLKK